MTAEQMKDALYKIKNYCQSHPGCKNCCFSLYASSTENKCFIKQYMTNEEGSFCLPRDWRQKYD